MPPDNFHIMKKLKDANFDGVSFNLEVWEKEKFKTLTPGKFKYGRKKMEKALTEAVKIFGKGNVYSNLVYGIQSFDGIDYSPEEENQICLEATKSLLDLDVVPLFTIYHSTGKNQIGKISINSDYCIHFFKEYARKVFNKNIVKSNSDSILFNVGSVANHPYNDFFYLEKIKSMSI